MNSSWLQKAIGYINKDTSEQNESPKLIVVIRILVLSMLFYIIINSIICVSILNNPGYFFNVLSRSHDQSRIHTGFVHVGMDRR